MDFLIQNCSHYVLETRLVNSSAQKAEVDFQNELKSDLLV